MMVIKIEITPDLCAGEIIETVPLVMRHIRREIRNQGISILSIPQLRSLIFLDRHPGSSLSNVAEHLGVTKATASALIDNLVKKGFVHRKEAPQERRRHILTVSETGLKELNQVKKVARENLAHLLENLPNEKLLKIVEGLTLLGTTFKDYELEK